MKPSETVNCDIISWLMDRRIGFILNFKQHSNPHIAGPQPTTQGRKGCKDIILHPETCYFQEGPKKKANSHPNSLFKRLKNYCICHSRFLPFYVWKILEVPSAIGSSRAFEVLVRCGIILDVRHPKIPNQWPPTTTTTTTTYLRLLLHLLGFDILQLHVLLGSKILLSFQVVKSLFSCSEWV